jgi:hypothetical protein
MDVKQQQQQDIKQQNMQQESMKQESMKQESMKQESMKQEGIKQEGIKQEGSKQEDKNQQGHFVDSLHKQLQELENNFQKQISELREKLFKGPQEKMQTESSEKKAEIKPLNYEVSYSSSSRYKDGKRDLKEHIEVKNPDLNLVADRLPGQEEFDVKIKKQGDKQHSTQKLPASQLKKEIDKVYEDLQDKTREDFSRLGMPFGLTCGSLFGSNDLPMIESCSSGDKECKEGEAKKEDEMKKESEAKKEDKKGEAEKQMARRPKGTNFFMHEMRNIEREMDYMRKRMDDEMKRFFKS